MSSADRLRRALLTAPAWPLAAPVPARAGTALPSVHVVALPRRTLRICLPDGRNERPAARFPVIYMHDAQNLYDDATAYAGEWGVDEAMARIAADTGFEAIVVGIDNGGAERMAELNPYRSFRHPRALGDAYLDDIVDTIKPWVDSRWRTLPDRRHTAMIGSSMGGLITQHAMCRHPGVFGAAGILSPSYWISDEAYAVTRAHPPAADARLFLYGGGRESESMLPDLRRMHALLAQQQQRPARLLRMDIAPDAGHNEAAWRAVFPTAVAWLFDL